MSITRRLLLAPVLLIVVLPPLVGAWGLGYGALRAAGVTDDWATILGLLGIAIWVAAIYAFVRVGDPAAASPPEKTEPGDE